MAVSDPTMGVATPTGVLQGVAMFGWDGSTWQPSGRAGPGVATPTGVLRGVAPFTWNGSVWAPAGQSQPGVATPTGVLDGVAIYTWSGSAWTPAGGQPTASTPTGALRGVAAFGWDGAAWQPAAQAGPDVATPFGVLEGVAPFYWSGGAWAPSAPPSLDLNFMTPGTLPTGVTFTRTTVGTWFDSTGTLQTAAINTPRWDYDPITHALRGLLIEEARTNLLLNSATLGTQTVTVAAAPYMLSFYGTGTVTLSGVASGSLVGTGAFPQRVSLGFTPTAGSLTLTVAGSVLNAQLETGAFPVATSWISTAGATVQRTADVALYVAAPLNANIGTLAVDVFLRQLPLVSANIEYLALDAGTASDIILLREAGTPPTGIGVVFASNVSQAQIASTPVVLGLNKLALTYSRGSPSTITTVANAGAVFSGTAASLPPPTRMTFGTGRNTPINSPIQRARYWPRVLSNSELQVVTT